MTKELLNKFINNQCTSEELLEVVNWLKTDALDSDLKTQSFQEWQKYKKDEFLLEEKKINSLLDKIHHKINISNNLHLKPKSTTKRSTLLIIVTRAAALLLVPVLAFLFYTLSKTSNEITNVAEVRIDSLEIVAPVGSKTIVQLPDGSEVFLNHGSKLKYPQKFVGATREVFLTGEGYFKVAHNSNMPFVVSTDKLNIKALGTEFNILAYRNEKNIETTLINGEVVLQEINGSRGNRILGKMEPGQHVKYNTQTQKITSTKGDVEKYISWKDGKLIFKNEPIEQIANRLNRWYNVDIEFANSAVKNLSYTATFVDETLFQILDLMELATPIKYNTLPRQKLKDGTFSRQKIIIDLKNNKET
ncbi:DUF4974 domain-containing protein [Draconibacterium sp.]|nr:DUF4974 domain-containing protein [Draconibacterium sp.]